jgi:transposase
MRRKIPQLEEAPRGHFDDHHGFICATMLRRIDALAADIAALDARIADVVTPHLEVIDRLDEIPGVGSRSAEELIAEIGLDMTVFPTAAHLASWAKFAPSTPNPRDGAKPAPPARAQPMAGGHPRRGRGVAVSHPHLPRWPLPAAVPPPRQETRHRRRRQPRADDRVGPAVRPHVGFHDLGPGYHESRINSRRRQRDLIRQLEHLTGGRVTLQPAA